MDTRQQAERLHNDHCVEHDEFCTMQADIEAALIAEYAAGRQAALREAAQIAREEADRQRALAQKYVRSDRIYPQHAEGQKASETIKANIEQRASEEATR